jgi:hypothetical protein
MLRIKPAPSVDDNSLEAGGAESLIVYTIDAKLEDIRWVSGTFHEGWVPPPYSCNGSPYSPNAKEADEFALHVWCDLLFNARVVLRFHIRMELRGTTDQTVRSEFFSCFHDREPCWAYGGLIRSIKWLDPDGKLDVVDLGAGLSQSLGRYEGDVHAASRGVGEGRLHRLDKVGNVGRLDHVSSSTSVFQPRLPSMPSSLSENGLALFLTSLLGIGDE